MRLIGFLRGINVGGHHRVPMAELREKLHDIGCDNVQTLLNTGNFVFDTQETNISELENTIEDVLSRSFGFPIPVILKTQQEISALVDSNPFEKIDMHKDMRLYVSLLKDSPEVALTIPYFSQDKTYTIIAIKEKVILSVLDLSTTSTPKGMNDLEKLFGKNITTRNWNTIKKITAIA